MLTPRYFYGPHVHCHELTVGQVFDDDEDPDASMSENTISVNVTEGVSGVRINF
jgi:hypothetical protein